MTLCGIDLTNRKYSKLKENLLYHHSPNLHTKQQSLDIPKNNQSMFSGNNQLEIIFIVIDKERNKTYNLMHGYVSCTL